MSVTHLTYWKHPFTLFLQQNLFQNKDTTSAPGKYEGLPYAKTLLPCTDADVAGFVIDFVRSLDLISSLHASL